LRHDTHWDERGSPASLGWIVAMSDFGLVLVGAAGALAAHYDVVGQASSGRHILTAIVAA